jgi:hypothetical protein
MLMGGVGNHASGGAMGDFYVDDPSGFSFSENIEESPLKRDRRLNEAAAEDNAAGGSAFASSHAGGGA